MLCLSFPFLFFSGGKRKRISSSPELIDNRLLIIVSVVDRLQLREFSEKVIDTKAAGFNVPLQYYASGIGGAGAGVCAGVGTGGGAAGSGSNAQMEVDSNASTPA